MCFRLRTQAQLIATGEHSLAKRSAYALAISAHRRRVRRRVQWWGGPLQRDQVAASRNIKTHPRTYLQLFTHVSQQHEGVRRRSLARPGGLRPRTGALPDSW